MPQYFFVAVTAAPSRTARSRPCASIDDALRGANFMLGNGAASAWIVDAADNVVLAAEQVRLRLEKRSVFADNADPVTTIANAVSR